MSRSWYSASIDVFQKTSDEQVVGELVLNSTFADIPAQKIAWLREIMLLRQALGGYDGWLHLEFNIPRMGRRIDAILLINGIVISIEFKINVDQYFAADIDQAYDYALDLKYFHEASHNAIVIPLLVATKARFTSVILCSHPRIHGLYEPVCTNETEFPSTLKNIIDQFPKISIDPRLWTKAGPVLSQKNWANSAARGAKKTRVHLPTWQC